MRGTFCQDENLPIGGRWANDIYAQAGGLRGGARRVFSQITEQFHQVLTSLHSFGDLFGQRHATHCKVPRGLSRRDSPLLGTTDEHLKK